MGNQRKSARCDANQQKNAAYFALYFMRYIAIIITAKEVYHMPNIKPISELRNYTEVLRDVSEGAPVFLTKNGKGRYALLDIVDYEKTQATIKLLSDSLRTLC
jgi:prevent-host-death family protein